MIDDPLARIHSHCQTCGEPTTYDPDLHGFFNLNGGERHACTEIDTTVCDCGVLLAISQHGWQYDRETRKPHLCELAIDEIERSLAFDRRSWSRRPIRHWRIPTTPAARVGRSWLP